MRTVYLDNNATTQPAPEVIEAMLPFFTELWGNPSSMHVFGGQVRRHVERARAQVQEMRLGDQAGDVAVLLLANYTYPDLVAATVAAEGLDVGALTLADFLALPQEFVDAWLVGVYALCPHWAPGRKPETAEAEAAEKNG